MSSCWICTQATLKRRGRRGQAWHRSPKAELFVEEHHDHPPAFLSRQPPHAVHSSPPCRPRLASPLEPIPSDSILLIIPPQPAIMDHTRDPCPWVALNDFGGAFCMGAIGGTVWHGVKGFRNTPKGERLIGCTSLPVQLGGNLD